MRKLLSALFPPAPAAPAPVATKLSATELEWLGWVGEHEGVTLKWLPGTAH